MSTQLRLRRYQEEALEAVWNAWKEGIHRPAVVLATGMGKTILFSRLASDFLDRDGRRVLVLAHRDELVDQAIDKIRGMAPHLSVGKVKASDNEVSADVVVASVQTLARTRRLDQLRGVTHSVGLIVTDEAHHALAPSYNRVYDAFPDALHLGVTATLARGDNRGLGSVWDEVVYERGIAWGIRQGYLSPVRGVAVRVPDLDLSVVKSSRGDYATGALGDAVERSGALDIIPAAYREHAAERPGVVFSPTVATAHHVAESMRDAGFRSAVISGETPREERLKIFEDYRTGRVQVLSNCMVLSEGFDAPHTACIVVARPTQSNPLYVQMVGRGTRTYPGKTDCLVLDVVGASSTNKLRTLVDLEPEPCETCDRTPCETCDRTPCVCPCKTCGGPRPCRDCNPDGELEADRGKTAETDLFAASSQSWLRTPAGTMFIPAGDGDVFLWPEDDGRWTVGWSPKRGRAEKLHTGMPMGSAMAWAEAEADERMPFSTARKASWRSKKPSEAQVKFADQLGIRVPDDVRSGDLGNMISVALAKRKFDR
jgi:superfamily II DNA or RNA helicase